MDRPDMLPGKCSLCGGMQYDGRKWIDFGLSIDWYGVVYLCTFCFKEIKDQIEEDESGFPVASFLALKEEKELHQKTISNLQTANANLTKKVTELKDELAALKHERNSVRSDSSAGGVSSKDKSEDGKPVARPTPKRRPANVQSNEKPGRTHLSLGRKDDS